MSTTTSSASEMTSSKPVYKSWALMAYEADEEERLEKEEEEREKLRKIVEERKYLLSIGEYELEDGEILE